MELSKTIILSNKSKSNLKGILNLKENKKSCLSLYNFEKRSGKFALGIKQNENIEKIILDISKNNFLFDKPNNINLDKKLSCAVVDISNDFCPEIVLSESITSNDDNSKIENAFVMKKPDDVSSLYEEDENLEKVVECNLEDDLNSTYYDCCAKCKYRQAFYENKDEKKIVLLSKDIEKNENVDNEKEISIFYEQIKSQVDKLFEKYEKDEVLDKIVPNSKWVRVDYEQNGDYYVLGLIYDDNNENVEYIAYGIPSNNNLNPPDDLKEYAKWLPISKENQNGFWIAYQDAKNGENIKIDIE